MSTKLCIKCNRILPIEHYHNNKYTKDGKRVYCKDCVSKYNKEYIRKNSNNPRIIYKQLVSRMKHYKTKPVTITEGEFVTWYEATPNICDYCDIPEELLGKLIDSHNNARTRLTIDCMDNDVGYAKGNVVFACNRCNNTKNNFFDHDTFREIAQKYIKPVWEKQLGYSL